MEAYALLNPLTVGAGFWYSVYAGRNVSLYSSKATVADEVFLFAIEYLESMQVTRTFNAWEYVTDNVMDTYKRDGVWYAKIERCVWLYGAKRPVVIEFELTLFY